MKKHILRDLDNPGPQRFDRWHALLVAVRDGKVTGYAVDSDGTVVDFKRGKRKGVDGKWHPAADAAVSPEVNREA